MPFLKGIGFLHLRIFFPLHYPELHRRTKSWTQSQNVEKYKGYSTKKNKQNVPKTGEGITRRPIPLHKDLEFVSRHMHAPYIRLSFRPFAYVVGVNPHTIINATGVQQRAISENAKSL